jgi:glycosyltransferase involved in cell wall biosynthesis
MALISVIIPTRSRPLLVQQAIESIVSNGNDSLQSEIILIDDSVTEETKKLAERYPLHYLRGPGTGVSAARNVGLRAASGNYVTFLDDDDTWPANNLVHQIALLDTNPQYGAVCSQVVLTDEQGTITSPPYPDPPFSSGWMFNDFLSYIPQVASLLVRREIALSVGDFDPQAAGRRRLGLGVTPVPHLPDRLCVRGGVYWRMHNTARFDGSATRPIEDIAWRRYTDVMDVAHRHLSNAQS